jgi:hypothetical protein
VDARRASLRRVAQSAVRWRVGGEPDRQPVGDRRCPAGQDSQTIDDTVTAWRDALVDGVSGTAQRITVSFNWPVHGDGTDPGDVSSAVSVTDPAGKAVPGTVSRSAGSATLVWTPTAALAAGTYAVSVNHLITESDGGAGSAMAAPYRTTVTIG